MKSIFLCLVLLLTSICYAQVDNSIFEKHYGEGESPYFYIFHKNSIEVGEYEKGIDFTKKYDYQVRKKSGIYFLDIPQKKKTYVLQISPEFLFLEDTENNLIDYYSSILSKGIEFFSRPDIAESNSYLQEGENSYSSKNLLPQILNKATLPFVPGKKEGWSKCILHLRWNDQFVKKNFLVLLSGYIDPSKPNLFLDNSRPKKIEIVNNNDKRKTYIFSLVDSPNPQILKFDSEFQDIEIRFLEVYKGKKWDDMCINLIYAGNI